MTKEEIKSTIDDISRVILLNKEAITPDNIKDAEAVIASLESPELVDLVQMWDSEMADKYRRFVVMARKFLEIEKRLADEGLQDRIYETLIKCRENSLVLSAIAALI